MKRLFMIPLGLIFLLGAIFTTGCTPMPYQEPYYIETEVVIIYEPVPYPDPGPVVHAPPPPPPRRRPLTPAENSGNPRTKTPRNDRDSGNTVIARGNDPQENPAPRNDRKPAKRKVTKRR